MVLIPAGTFAMGERSKFKTPKPEQVAEFCLDRTEVTVAAYGACVKSGKCTPALPDPLAIGVSFECNRSLESRAAHPVNCVDWREARTYCETMGGRLPTELEWEYAARSGEERRYPWGAEEPKDQLCWKPNASGHTCPVGSYPQGNTTLGLSDMAGNVWEWVASPYAFGDAHGIRGGSWDNDKEADVRTTRRHGDVSGLKTHFLGFRCAMNPKG